MLLSERGYLSLKVSTITNLEILPQSVRDQRNLSDVDVRAFKLNVQFAISRCESRTFALNEHCL